MQVAIIPPLAMGRKFYSLGILIFYTKFDSLGILIVMQQCQFVP